MTNTDTNGLVEVRVENILDWAFCPLRFWWRNQATMKEVADSENHKAGEYLMRTMVVGTLKRYVKEHQAILKSANPSSPGRSLMDVHGWMWGLFLQKSGLSHLGSPLIEYLNLRRALEAMFSEKGNQRKPDGAQYKRPSSSNVWRDHFVVTGMLELQRAIDSNQSKAGIATLPLADDEFFMAPMGLADAYAISELICENLEGKLPEVNTIVNVDVPVYVDLLSVRLRTNVDILVDRGTAPNRPGRPKAEGDSVQRRYYQFHTFSFEEYTPSIYDTAKNLRLMALRQSLPVGTGIEEAVLEDVIVWHLRTGKTESFTPSRGENIDVLESLSRAFKNGSRAGHIVPRMVHSWAACQDCEYRGLCFDGNGVMEAFNPPLVAQIQAGQEMTRQLTAMVQNVQGQKPEDVISAFQSFATWMNSSPGLSPEGVLWMLDSIKAEME
jgi:hypothetical protein